VEVHRHPVQDLVEARLRDAEVLDRRRERFGDRVLRRAGEERRDLAAPPCERRRRDRRVGALVDDVVTSRQKA
jgi:hypothetical protein